MDIKTRDPRLVPIEIVWEGDSWLCGGVILEEIGTGMTDKREMVPTDKLFRILNSRVWDGSECRVEIKTEEDDILWPFE